MGDAGLTHGSFYSYFTSKEALIKEAVETGMDDKLKQTIKAARTPQKGVSQQFLTAGIGLPCELFFESAYLLANVGGMFRRLAIQLSGHLRLFVTIDLGQSLVTRLISSFLQVNPKVTAELGLSSRPLHMIQEGCDVGILPGKITDESVVARPAERSLYSSPLRHPWSRAVPQ